MQCLRRSVEATACAAKKDRRSKQSVIREARALTSDFRADTRRLEGWADGGCFRPASPGRQMSAIAAPRPESVRPGFYPILQIMPTISMAIMRKSTVPLKNSA